MKNFSTILSAVAVVLAAAALVTASKKGGNVDGAKISEFLTENPKVIIDSLQAYQDKQRIEQEKAAAEAMAKFAPQISDDSNVPSIGPKDAKITVVEFFDFSCGYCKMLAPTIEKVMSNNTDVKFIFKPLSFVAQVSSYQAKAGFAAHKQGKFAEFYKEVMGSKERMTEASVDAAAEKIGLDMDAYKKDVQSDDIKEALKAVADLAQNIQVNGVPTVFINGKQVSARDVEAFQAEINAVK